MTLRHLVLNTAKGRFNATVAGRSVVLANPAGIDGRPTRYGLEVAVRRLLLTGAGARAVDRALGAPHLFVAGARLARAQVSGETFTVPVGPASLEFSFDEGFRQKLASLGVAVAGSGSATQLSSTPLAFSFPDAGGSGNRGLGRGGVASRSSLHLSQGTFPDQHEAAIGISMSFESQLVGTVRETWPSSRGGAPFGEASFAGVAAIDAATGLIGAPPTVVTLSPYGVAELNEAFGGGSQRFSAGEPLGTLAFSGRLGR